MRSTRDYADVPAVQSDAEVDPHWLELRGEDHLLPASYLPPAMAGTHPGWMRIAVWVLITVFITATMLGVCLTYGPGN